MPLVPDELQDLPGVEVEIIDDAERAALLAGNLPEGIPSKVEVCKGEGKGHVSAPVRALLGGRH